MKLQLFLIATFLLWAVHSETKKTLNPDDIVKILQNEPEAASKPVTPQLMPNTHSFRESRFLSSRDCPGNGCFQYPNGNGGNGNSNSEDDDLASSLSDFDKQIEEIDGDLNRLKDSVKQAQECAQRMQEDKAQIKNLQETKEKLKRDKARRILQAKLQRQSKDLNDVNMMKGSLHSKMSQLKKTQNLIFDKLAATRTALRQLDGDVVEEDLSESGDVTNGMDAYHKLQTTSLESSQKSQKKDVENSIKSFQKIHEESKASESQSS